jgi:beta-1,4-mannosyl-glycoprotein beta-1,4-N-acetylglucosaminyltransferase
MIIFYQIRIKELYNVVEKFVILEANSTFTGLPKKLVFEENKERFAFAKDKIVYKQLDLPPRKPGEDPFKLEEAHRIAMNAHIYDAGGRPGDWVLMMDVDEIPSWHTVTLFKNCDEIPSPMHLQLRNFVYSFEFLLDMESWRGKAARLPHNYGHSRSSDYILADAGWHCSFCFKTLKDFQFKMKGYSHADRVHSQDMLDLDRIQKVICEGEDIFDMLPEAWTYKDLIKKWGKIPKQTSGIELPIALLQDPKKYRFLLPGGCKREKE